MEKKWNYVLLLGMFSICVVKVSYAQEFYQTEISASHSSSKSDNYDATDTAVVLTQHFSPVDTADHPLAEAAFLERIGSVGLLIGTLDVQYASGPKVDGPEYGAMLTYMKPDMPILLQAGFIKADVEFSPPYDADMTMDLYALGLGGFIEDGILFAIQHSHSETELSGPGILAAKTESNIYQVVAKYVGDLSDGVAFNVEGTLGIKKYDDGSADNTNTIAEVSGDYYINARNSIALGLSVNTGGNISAEGKGYAIGFNSFLNPNFNIDIGFAKFVSDDIKSEDAESLKIALSARF